MLKMHLCELEEKMNVKKTQAKVGVLHKKNMGCVSKQLLHCWSAAI